MGGGSKELAYFILMLLIGLNDYSERFSRSNHFILIECVKNQGK